MIVTTFSECVEIYKSFDGWLEENDKERLTILDSFPYSVVIQGNFLEYDMASKWCEENVGKKKICWKDIFYTKTDYDFGFWEIFFKNEKSTTSFKDVILNFYAETPVAKWKTRGSNHENDINLK